MQPPPNRPIHNEKSETVIKAMQIVFVAEQVRKDVLSEEIHMKGAKSNATNSPYDTSA
jgi:hypothetical protein